MRVWARFVQLQSTKVNVTSRVNVTSKVNLASKVNVAPKVKVASGAQAVRYWVSSTSVLRAYAHLPAFQVAASLPVIFFP